MKFHITDIFCSNKKASQTDVSTICKKPAMFTKDNECQQQTVIKSEVFSTLSNI